MSFFDITYSSVWKKLVPPNKWSQEVLDWGTSLLSPLQWGHDLFFGGYSNGDTTSPAYSGSTAYVKGNRVRYNNRIYECIITPPGSGDLPTDVNYWIQIQADWRGVNERILYDGQKLILEYILNRWFGTTFNQPPNTASSTYFITSLTPGAGFIIHSSGPDSIYATRRFQKAYIKASYTFQPYDFQVNYPSSISSDQIAQMKSLISKYKLYGTNPKYISY